MKIIEEPALRALDPYLFGFVNVNTPLELEQAEAVRRQQCSPQRSVDS